MKVYVAIVISSVVKNDSSRATDEYVSICSIFPKCTNQTRQIGINIHRLTVVQYVFFIFYYLIR